MDWMGWIESLNILSLWGFLFFLLVFLKGYIFVEIYLWKDYFFIKKLEKYDNSIFDRIIHYISWWIILNILFTILWGIMWFYDKFANLLNSAWELSKALSFIWDPISLQFIIFSLWYFLIVMIFLLFLCLFYRFVANLANIFEFILKIKDIFKNDDKVEIDKKDKTTSKTKVKDTKKEKK